MIIPIVCSSCGDDDPENAAFLTNYLDGEYTPGSGTKQLSATVDGADVAADASVTFRAGDMQKGSMTLNRVFPGYDAIEIKELVFNQGEEGDSSRLTFSGTQKVNDTFSFSYSGYYVPESSYSSQGHLYIELTTHPS